MNLKVYRIFLTLIAAAGPAAADEGLWPYNQLPKEVPAEIASRLQSAAVRIGGGSGAFVSPEGLILTARPAAEACKIPIDGFTAKDRASELRCAGLDASVLLGIEDVSAKLKATGPSLAQRNAAIALVEKNCSAKAGETCAVVRLFSGGRYDLYRYRRYSDIRLVFAPEYSVAFFGRERDSLTYLRYGLNIAFLRAYEDGRPARTPDFLGWSPDGVKDGDRIFSAADPGPTSRLATAAQLAFYRDTSLPVAVARLRIRLQSLAGVSSPVAQETVTRLIAQYKSSAGKLIGLRDDRLVTRKTNFEGKIRRAVGTDADKIWDEVANAYKKWAPSEKPYQLLESDPAPGSILFEAARRNLRHEPNAGAPGFDPQTETIMLTQYLDELKSLGEKEAPLKSFLARRTLKEAAETMVRAKDASSLASAIEPAALKLRKQHEETIGTLEVSAAEKIAQFRFKLFGAADYPDGSGTPRVALGSVQGYVDRAGVAQPFASTFSGLYYRHNNQGPWQVEQKWIDLRPRIYETLPLDFVSTCDLGGGDYGGPAVNAAGELVGVTFDGNLESLPNVFLYVGDQARAVNVDARGIAESLDKIYKAESLLKELGLRRITTALRRPY